ncbi:uncharacterized protein HMPREF1541_02151 [Cyphellophora europaea CBS 101466]|uniref:RCC1-like domain-containing protein n=1 Tax=Cyphellophora europaea (strain CBS 101466) TaxID=1220924 RepID=W2S4M0_CYPE1|nr:uncharacterized protein HMPREF1541_02151 [Cyphellophora europaea CBS 101466]ETN42993.1 hypothetical protein HMPREF1541_02151 [Cyphellophora europaea CBS 101466]
MTFRILAFGSNGSGQLGVGHVEDTSSPQQCQFATNEWQPGETVSQIAAGGNHTLLLTTAGRVFASGSNDNGRCGTVGQMATCNTFHSVIIPQQELGRVTHVAATWEASFFVVDAQRIYSCGSGAKGELGLGVDRAICKVPELVVDLADFENGQTRVAELKASMGHVVLVADQGDLFGWGGCRRGQLGEEIADAKVIWSPRKISIASSVRTVALGRDFTYMVGSNGICRLMGNNKHFPDIDSIHNFHPQNEVFAGWSNIFIRNEEQLVGFGRNNHGQLPPQHLSASKYFAAGSEHCLALTHDNRLLSWGWGEHGNCGRPLDDQGKVAGRFNEIPMDLTENESVSLVAAGCATSFVVVSKAD